VRVTITWHRPLLWLAASMAVLAVAITVASFIDPRVVTGAEVWLKPLKFALSIGIYALTLSWLIGQLGRLRRLASIAGTVSVVGLAIEMIIIVGVAATGQTSHFNVSTPFHAALWSIMAVSIVMVWIMTFVVAIALFRNPFGDAARTFSIRAGAIVALVGMGLAFLMTGPTAAQLDDFQGIAGAHTVGVADGGPGLFLLGWSTVAGDLRIPHFVGMHALQALPILVLLLELLGRHVPAFADPRRRLRLVQIAAVTYALALADLTAQALAGQSIVRPAGPVFVAGILIAACAIVAGVIVTVMRRTSRQARVG
jgi:hypothetical protein